MSSLLQNRLGMLVDYWLQRTRLDLSGHRLLTEAATGNFAAMPALALKAGADHVYAWARDSRYGTAAQAIEETTRAVEWLGQETSRLTCLANERPTAHLGDVTLVANSGNVRPLDAGFLGGLCEGTTIAVMYDAWELRKEDLDLDACRQLGIRVVGVEENHSSLRIFDACGPLALKMCFEAGYEVAHNRIFVFSEDPFGEVIGKAFRAAGAAEVMVSKDLDRLEACYAELDFLFLCSYREERSLVGEQGVIRLREWQAPSPPGIVHLYGKVDSAYAEQCGHCVYPSMDGQAMRMTRTLDALGPKISLGLYAAGLSVAAAVANGEASPGGAAQIMV